MKEILRCLLPYALFVLALSLRVPLCNQALPYTQSWDEPYIMNAAIRILKTGDLNPDFFRYPSGYIYLETAVAALTAFQLAKSGVVQYPGQIENYYDTKYFWTVSHPELYRNGRFLTAMLGSLLVVITYFCGLALHSMPVGLLAALFMALSPFAIEHSAVITTDMPAAFFAGFSIWWFIRIVSVSRPDWTLFAAAGICTGLAISMKYNAALLVLPFVASHILAYRKFLPLDRHAWYYGLYVAVSFFAMAPFVILDFDRFLADLMYEFRHYGYSGHAGIQNSRFSNLQSYVQEFSGNAFTGAVCFLVIPGLIWTLLAGKRAWVPVVLFLAVYTYVFSGMKVHFFRNLLPVFMPVALAAALLPGHISDAIKRNGGSYGQLSFLPFVLGALCMSPAIPDSLRLIRDGRAFVPSRTKMLDHILKELPPDARVAIDENLHMYIPPLIGGNRLITTDCFSKSSDWFKKEAFNYILIAGSYKYPAANPDHSRIEEFLNGRFATLPVVWEEGHSALTFGEMPKQPKLLLKRLDGELLPLKFTGTVPGLAMSGYYRVFSEFETGAKTLWSKGKLSCEVDLATTSSQLRLIASGISAEVMYPEITIRARTAGSEVEIARSTEIKGWNTYPEFKYPCNLGPGRWTIEFEFINPQAFPTAQEEKNIRRFGIKLLSLE